MLGHRREPKKSKLGGVLIIVNRECGGGGLRQR